MKVLLASGAAVCTAVAVAAWLFFGVGQAAGPGKVVPSPARPDQEANRLIVHEWGTFTSFSGSDGAAASFTPNNADLPGFVYSQIDDDKKGAHLNAGGTVSMETPVVYFYADREMRASIKVDFPKGWITEWYPFAATAPSNKGRNPRAVGQSMRWDVKLLPADTVHFPKDKAKTHYYEARDTDALAVQAEVALPEERGDWELRGGTVVQREKFLFYRGVGTFPLPATVQALGDGKVRVKNASGGRLNGLVLVAVRGGKVGSTALQELDAGADLTATLPEANGKSADLGALLVKELTAAGLYEKEARAMVKTWDSAWFGEDGTRLLYLVPRTRTDELLPLTVEPKPAETVRVLVGRHDFLTPEQEASAERQVRRVRAARAESEAAEAELGKIGRFGEQARALAEKRLDARSAQK